MEQRPCRVLIVNNHRDYADSIYDMLRAHGSFDVQASYTAEYAESVARGRNLDLILITNDLPNIADVGPRLMVLAPKAVFMMLCGQPIDPAKLLEMLTTSHGGAG